MLRKVSGSEAPILHPAQASLKRWSVVRTAAACCIVVGLGLALGACTKCDVPNLTAPHACHDGPAPQ